MRPYQPSHKIGDSAFIWLLFGSIGSGAIVGWLTSLLAVWIYLVVLFPILMGIGGGLGIAIAVHTGKVRNPKLAAGFGLLTGIILYGSMHAGEYFQFKKLMTDEAAERVERIDTALVEKLTDVFLKSETGSEGFVGYMKYKAQNGVSISRRFSTFNLGTTGTLAYWMIEIAIVSFITAVAAYGAAENPFCEECSRWYGVKKLLGGVPYRAAEDFLKAIKEDEYKTAATFFSSTSKLDEPGVEVEIQQCKCCTNTDVMVVLNEVSLGDKGEIKRTKIMKGMVSAKHSNELSEMRSS